MVCLCMWWDGEGRANAKVIHVPATVCQRPGVTRRGTLEKRNPTAIQIFPHFFPRVDVDRGDFGVEED